MGCVSDGTRDLFARHGWLNFPPDCSQGEGQ
jgi:hypothetical protein